MAEHGDYDSFFDSKAAPEYTIIPPARIVNGWLNSDCPLWFPTRVDMILAETGIRVCALRNYICVYGAGRAVRQVEWRDNLYELSDLFRLS
jgi:hypothetical protein